MKKIIRYLNKMLYYKRGQGLVEYGLILAVVALLIAVAMTPIGNTIAQILNNVEGSISGVFPVI